MYSDENKLLQAVSSGNITKAKSILANIPLFRIESRTEDLRNLKNHTIIMNTLLRKAAEEGGVHPIYIDQVSSSFAKQLKHTPARIILLIYGMKWFKSTAFW